MVWNNQAGRRALALLTVAVLAGATPAESLPLPEPERCVGFLAEPDDDGEAIAPMGLSYDEVVPALNGVLPAASRCPRPSGVRELHLTFDLLVGCDGLVDVVEVVDTGGAPASYVQCMSAVLERADFPAHDMHDGMPITYPVDVRW